jgi:toxin-antitoxin system PIN domain toxin
MPDVNLLIAAHRRDHPLHLAADRSLHAMIEAHEGMALTPAVATGFVRIVTCARAFPDPTPVAVAVAFIDTLLAMPRVRWLAPGRLHWAIFRRLCIDVGASGKAAADAHHAAGAIEADCTWWSADREFARYVPYGLAFQCVT